MNRFTMKYEDIIKEYPDVSKEKLIEILNNEKEAVLQIATILLQQRKMLGCDLITTANEAVDRLIEINSNRSLKILTEIKDYGTDEEAEFEDLNSNIMKTSIRYNSKSL